MHFTNYELGIAQKLLGQAMANAANACSQMTNVDFLVHNFVVEQTLDWQDNWLPNANESETFFVLTTHIKGDLQGVNFLILTRPQACKLLIYINPDSKFNHSSTLSEYDEAILLELDNIISGAFVSKLANYLSGFVYGDVPLLREINHDQIRVLIGEQTYGYGVKISSSTALCHNSELCRPIFICLFSQGFVLGIQKMISQNKHTELDIYSSK